MTARRTAGAQLAHNEPIAIFRLQSGSLVLEQDIPTNGSRCMGVGEMQKFASRSAAEHLVLHLQRMRRYGSPSFRADLVLITFPVWRQVHSVPIAGAVALRPYIELAPNESGIWLLRTAEDQPADRFAVQFAPEAVVPLICSPFIEPV